MKDRVILMSNFNAHKLKWNLHYSKIRDVAGIKRLIEGHDQILKNEPGKATRPTRQNISLFIDVTFTIQEIRARDS